MAANRVLRAGAIWRETAGRYYELTCWYVLDGGGRMQERTYDRLTWHELLDVLENEMAEMRPGWEIGQGWLQPPLDFEDD